MLFDLLWIQDGRARFLSQALAAITSSNKQQQAVATCRCANNIIHRQELKFLQFFLHGN